MARENGKLQNDRTTHGDNHHRMVCVLQLTENVSVFNYTTHTLHLNKILEITGMVPCQT